MSKSPHPSFGPGYVPPAERIRREQASQRQPGADHDFRPRPNQTGSNGFSPWTLGLVVVVGGGLLVAGSLHLSERYEHNNASCRELSGAIGHYLDADPNAKRVHVERSRDVLEAVEIHARVSREFAAALDSLELTDPSVSALRDRFVDHAFDEEEVINSFRCTFIANQAEVCDFARPDALEEIDRERSRLLKEFNNACPTLDHEWALETELDRE